ncbi:hypothetical protein ANN_22801 [Periplaneta americana]|uniref:Uncharacterized protein n=1 Tax=Periplaneta americana TaxID=6978 RepID=A0ABQ8SKC1_PERAM|nr:hypothetical protein ANN_22801 [Periplaneta americana]
MDDPKKRKGNANCCVLECSNAYRNTPTDIVFIHSQNRKLKCNDANCGFMQYADEKVEQPPNVDQMVAFKSKCYRGRSSDTFITTDCGLLTLLEGGDEVRLLSRSLAENGSTRRADIIAIDRRNQRSLILDTTVRFEKDDQQANNVNDENKNYKSKVVVTSSQTSNIGRFHQFISDPVSQNANLVDYTSIQQEYCYNTLKTGDFYIISYQRQPFSGSSAESYPAFALNGLRENPEKKPRGRLSQPGFKPMPTRFTDRHANHYYTAPVKGLDRPAGCWPHAHMPMQRWTIIQPEWRYRVVSTMIPPAVIAGIRNRISLPIVAPQVHYDAKPQPGPDRDSNPGHLVSRPDELTVTPQVWTPVLLPDIIYGYINRKKILK